MKTSTFFFFSLNDCINRWEKGYGNIVSISCCWSAYESCIWVHLSLSLHIAAPDNSITRWMFVCFLITHYSISLGISTQKSMGITSISMSASDGHSKNSSFWHLLESPDLFIFQLLGATPKHTWCISLRYHRLWKITCIWPPGNENLVSCANLMFQSINEAAHRISAESVSENPSQINPNCWQRGFSSVWWRIERLFICLGKTFQIQIIFISAEPQKPSFYIFTLMWSHKCTLDCQTHIYNKSPFKPLLMQTLCVLPSGFTKHHSFG